jgi:hypothetical protein
MSSRRGASDSSHRRGISSVVLLNGEAVMDVYITHDIEEAKRGRYLD